MKYWYLACPGMMVHRNAKKYFIWLLDFVYRPFRYFLKKYLRLREFHSESHIMSFVPDVESKILRFFQTEIECVSFYFFEYLVLLASHMDLDQHKKKKR